MQGIQGKIALVTGAANGIGAAISRRLYAEGANIALVDWSEEQLEETVKEFDADRVMSMVVDVSDPVQVETMISEVINRFGQLDILANNAGIHIPGTVLETTVEDWKKVSGVDIDGVVYCAKFAPARID